MCISLILTATQLLAGNDCTVKTNCNSLNTCTPASKLIFTQSTVAPFATDTSDSWSVSFIDYDNDGNDDLFFTNKDKTKPSLLYRNLGNGTFTKITTNNITKTLSTACTSTWADIDNDGDLDVFIANDTKFMNELFINDGKGNLTLSTNSGLTNSVGYYQSASWVDYDRDGFVDLYVGNYCTTRFNELYHNNGNGTFTQITNTPITMQQGNGVGATWADYDNDGYPDLFVPDNHQLKNQLYHNNGNGNFTAITTGAIVTDGGASVASCWGDVDNDGDLDLFVANSNAATGSYFYKNNGNGTFTKITNSIITQGGNSHGCNFVDIDNDGDLDLLVCNDIGVKFLYLNDGAGNFTAKTDEPLCKDFGFSFANSWSDFDKDGDMDVAIATHSNQKNFLFTNNSSSLNNNNWISIRLIGNVSNKSAIGARIKIVTGSRKQIGEVNAQSGFGGQNSLWNHFGLNTSTTIDSIIINWPSGIHQVIIKQRINQFLTINELSTAKVTGTVFQDLNNNCTFNTNEKGMVNVKVKATPGNLFTYTDNNGNYTLRLAPGTYTISFVTPTNYSTTCTSQYAVTIKSTETVSAKNFALKASKNGTDMFTAISATALRRGMRNKTVVEYGNQGNQISCTDTMKITPDANVTFLSSDKPWSFKKDGSYYWVISNLNSGDAFTFQMIDSVSKNATIGTLINLQATISGHCSDLNNANNTSTFNQKTVGAVDPNDMIVYTNRADSQLVSKTDTLHYRINFQNVGNYEATNIIVTSTIPDGLDASTFTQGISSNNYSVSINGNQITWLFDSIALPDSSTNLMGSNAFVEFSLMPNQTVKAGDVIFNSAQVQFDYENPLATNQVKSIIMPDAANNENAMQLYPNPATSVVNFTLNTVETAQPLNITNYSIFNINGAMVMQGNQSALMQQIEVTNLQSGWYIIAAIDEQGGKHTAKFIKQ